MVLLIIMMLSPILLVLWLVIDYILQSIYDDRHRGTHTGKDWSPYDHWSDDLLSEERINKC